MAAGSNGKVVSNGKAVDPKPKETNGHVVVKPKKRSTIKQKKSFSLFSTVTRILTWYSIITIFFRCPSTVDLVTDSSPNICKPYFQLQSIVAPHLEPYYDSYAAPYVNSAKPYYNTLDKKAITPVTALGKKYGAPRVAQAQAYGQAQWEKTLQPEVLKYQAIAKAKYDQTVAPHLNKVTTVTGPYVQKAQASASQTYHGHIVPTFNTVQPYAVKGYGIVSNFVVGTGIPYTKWVGTTTAVFLDRKVWPKLRILYGENVEPQLVRIGERLGRYRDGKKLKAVVDSVDSSSSASSVSSSISSISSSISASAHTTSTSASSSYTSTTSSENPDGTPLSEAEIRENAKAIVAKDLKTWQEKFSKAADEGSDEVDERVTEITSRLIKNQAGKVGSALIIELEETVKSNLNSLKDSIISIVQSKKDSEASEDALNTAVRKAGVAIKEKAQAVRTWRQSFDAETDSLIGKSVQDTFDIIDHIRDLGLQEIGMRWAWTDGITHKDWTKYHALKKKFDEWRVDVEKVILEHPDLKKARAASEEVESKAMDIAENAAMELARLKETARWKISTGDSSDDFSTKFIPAAAQNAAQKVADKFSGATEGLIMGTTSTQGTMESVASAAESVASSISSSVIGTSQGSVESVASVAKESVSSVVDAASSSIIGTSQGNVESVTSVVAEQASILSAKVSASVLGEEPGMVEKASSSVQSAASDISKSASSVSKSLDSASSSVASSLSKSATQASSSLSSSASSVSSSASKKVWGGAMAANVEAREIVYDDVVEDFDDETPYSEKIQSMASAAGDKFSDVTKAVSEALAKPTTSQGSVESMTKLAAEQYSSALAAASSAMYGTEQGTVESMTSIAGSRYADAVSAASAVIYGTPTPALDSAASSARAAYSDALSKASEHYDQARSVVSAKISGTPKPAHEEMLSSAEQAYSGAVAAASSRLQGALTAASTAVYGLPTGAVESIQSVAASRLSEGLAAASSQYDAAKRYIGPTSTPAAQQLMSQAQNQYYAGIGLAHARYSEFLEAASSAVMPAQTPFYQSVYDQASASIVGTGTPAYESMKSKASTAVYGSETPLTESIASVASENWEALVTKASHQVYGSPTPYFVTGNFMSNVQEYAAQATDGAASQYSAVQSLINELVSGKEPDFTESVYSRLSSAYYTGAGDTVSSASSYASDIYASASSFANSVFTPPPAVESILDSASLQINEAIAAASNQVYGTEKGYLEKASSSASAAYSSASSVASESVHGTQPSYGEQAQLSISNAAASAQKAISEAIYGTPTAAFESATKVIAENFESATLKAAESYSAAQAKISEAIYGQEKGAVESAQARLNSVVEAARLRLSELAANAGEGASDAISRASEGVEDMASSVGSMVGEATGDAKVKKDEL